MKTLLIGLLAVLTLAPGIAGAVCPTSVLFEPTAGGELDAGWAGFVSDLPIFGTTLPLGVSCAVSTPPCGTCAITGLAPAAGDHRFRCDDDTSKECSVATQVADCGPSGACRYFPSPPQSLGVGGVPLCLATSIDGPIAGTVDVESGTLAATVSLRSTIFDGVFFDVDGGPNQGCPRCLSDLVPDDGIQGGFCNAGPRVLLPCDAHGTSPITDFGSTSFDCPPDPLFKTTTLHVGPLSFSTTGQSVTLSPASPPCSAGAPLPPGTRCFCSTCNTAAAEPCGNNGDCPPSGGNPGICNGRRCIGGINTGSPCVQNSECPGGGICGRTGEPSKPNSCHDNTTTPELEACTPDGNGRGRCADSPIDSYCANHPNRGCNEDADCDNVPGACTFSLRPCYPDNAVIGATISVDGVATPPVGDVASPTELGALVCLSPTSDPFTNIVWGLPGLARIHQSGRLTFDDAPPAPTPTPVVTPTPGLCPLIPGACRTPIASGKASLKLDDTSDDTKDQLGWKWMKGAGTTVAELGNPAGSDDYLLCLYDGSGWRATMAIPAGADWQQKSKGFVYRKKDGDPHGITQLVLKAGDAGKAQMQAKGKGAALPIPPLLTLSSPIRVQLRNHTTGLCWGASYSAPFDKATATQLKAKAD